MRIGEDGGRTRSVLVVSASAVTREESADNVPRYPGVLGPDVRVRRRASRADRVARGRSAVAECRRGARAAGATAAGGGDARREAGKGPRRGGRGGRGDCREYASRDPGSGDERRRVGAGQLPERRDPVP